MMDENTENLVEQVVRITGESKTEAVRRALEERLQRLSMRVPGDRDLDRLITFLQDEIWSQIPPELLGKSIAKEEEEEILGYGGFG